MAYEAKKFPLEGKLDGISDNQLQQHRDILYTGYINKLNEITEKLRLADRSKANAVFSEFRELKAEESFALNGVILHELYFENLGGKGTSPGKDTKKVIEREFISYEKFLEDFKACGMCARGWVIFGYSVYDGKVHNYILDTHHFHAPVRVVPVVVLDMYEHAYMIDYGVKKALYIDAFIKNIDWNVAENRLTVCSGIRKKIE